MSSVILSNESADTGSIDLEPGPNFSFPSDTFEIATNIQVQKKIGITRVEIPSTIWDIDVKLIQAMLENDDLESSIVECLRELSSYFTGEEFDEPEILAYLDTHKDTTYEFPAIRVRANISSLNQWEEVESDVDEIIENNEVGDVLIYPILDAKGE